ncbi:hypothetical protein H6H01_13075 [Nostoc calcicola FACHB-3891]|nr:hypothetical protein [Nostoc calcicola FACHB-3891]
MEVTKILLPEKLSCPKLKPLYNPIKSLPLEKSVMVSVLRQAEAARLRLNDRIEQKS